MSYSEILYTQSVGFAEQAEMAEVKRLPVDYKNLYAKAYWLQSEAALNMPHDKNYPMPRSFMIQGAAGLAYKAGLFDEAEKMIALCRSENPPGLVAHKLDEIEKAIRQESAAPLKNGSLQVRGILTQANADEKEITIRDMENQRTYAFIVPSKIFKSVVKDYWQELVSAVGKASPHGVFTLEKISPAA